MSVIARVQSADAQCITA